MFQTIQLSWYHHCSRIWSSYHASHVSPQWNFLAFKGCIMLFSPNLRYPDRCSWRLHNSECPCSCVRLCDRGSVLLVNLCCLQGQYVLPSLLYLNQGHHIFSHFSFMSLLTVWSMKFISIIFKNPIPSTQKTHCTSITKTNWFMTFRKIIAVYCQNHTVTWHIKARIVEPE
jgi:hypothetical protein